MINLKEYVINEGSRSWSVYPTCSINGATYDESEQVHPKSTDYLVIFINLQTMEFASKSQLKFYDKYFSQDGKLESACGKLKKGQSYFFEYSGRDKYELTFVKL